MIRILHMIGSLNIGGSQTMIMNIYRNIDKDKIQFDFIVDHENELYFADEIKKMGGKIYFMPRFTGTNIIKIVRSWNEFFKKHPEYNIIHSHVRSYASIFLAIAKKNGLYTIIHSHSTSNGNGIKSFIKKILQFPLRYQADYFFACSEEAGKWLYGSKIINTNKFKELNNCIDIERYLPNEETRNIYRKKLNINEKTVIGHVGRFHKSKNHDKLLEIFLKYKNINSNAVLLLIGDGEEKEYIENKILNLGIKKDVILLGDRSDVPELLQAMDLFVFPSYWEGFGIVLIEAQIARLKIIASNSVPKNTCISNNIKYIPIIEDSDYWAEKCNEILISNNNDYKLNSAKVEKFDIKSQVKTIEKFYLSIWEEKWKGK